MGSVLHGFVEIPDGIAEQASSFIDTKLEELDSNHGLIT